MVIFEIYILSLYVLKQFQHFQLTVRDFFCCCFLFSAVLFQENSPNMLLCICLSVFLCVSAYLSFSVCLPIRLSLCLCVLQVFSLTILSALALNKMASQDTLEEMISSLSGQEDSDPIVAEIISKKDVIPYK